MESALFTWGEFSTALCSAFSIPMAKQIGRAAMVVSASMSSTHVLTDVSHCVLQATARPCG